MKISSLCLLTARRPISPGRSLMGYFIALSICPPLVMPSILPVLVALPRNPWSIFSFTALSPLVVSTGSNLFFSMLFLMLLLFLFVTSSLTLVRMNWWPCHPSYLCCLLQVLKFCVWHQRNDFRFRSVRPSAPGLFASINSRVHFHLPLYYKRFTSAPRGRYFTRQRCASGVVCSVNNVSFIFYF